MIRHRLTGLLLLFSLAASPQPNPEKAGPFNLLLIRGVTVIDGSGAPAFGPVDVYIKGNTIDAIVATDVISRGTDSVLMGGGPSSGRPDRVIEGKGMYLMPGLIDVHSHINSGKDVPAEYIYKLFLGHGVTTIRAFNVGDEDVKGMLAEQARSARNEIIAPRIYVYPYWRSENDPRFNDPTGARQVVDEWHAMGVDGIKIVSKPGLWPDVFQAIASQARKDGMGVAVHIGQDGVYPMNAVRIAHDGATTIEHHYGYPESAYSGHRIQNLPPEYNYSNESERFLETGRSWLQADVSRLHGAVIQSLLDSQEKNGFIMVPTFGIYEANRDVTRAQNLPWLRDYGLPAVVQSFFPNPERHAAYFYDWTSNKEADWRRAYRIWMEFVNDYKNQGGTVAVGSDSGYLFSLWGFGTIRELELLEEAGFSPLEALNAATENGAKVVKNPRLGLLRPGYLADMVLVSGNPLADVKVLYGSGITRVSPERKAMKEQCVKYTIKGGVVFDSQQLLNDVKALVRNATQPVP
ncbi:MAG: amidohydrolase family protein [Acidobacteria bacterium]|nr:amidohydrolase family protein [Acidobacteriota bacterium]